MSKRRTPDQVSELEATKAEYQHFIQQSTLALERSTDVVCRVHQELSDCAKAHADLRERLNALLMQSGNWNRLQEALNKSHADSISGLIRRVDELADDGGRNQGVILIANSNSCEILSTNTWGDIRKALDGRFGKHSGIAVYADGSMRWLDEQSPAHFPKKP
jgi:hypothetical protein